MYLPKLHNCSFINENVEYPIAVKMLQKIPNKYFYSINSCLSFEFRSTLSNKMLELPMKKYKELYIKGAYIYIPCE